MEIKDSKTNKQELSEGQEIVELFFRYLSNWKLTLFLIILSLSVGLVYLLVTPKIYEAKASVLLIEENGKGRASGGEIDLESLGLFSTTSNIENEVEIFSSPDLMLEVVKSLDLHYNYTLKTRLREIDIYHNAPYLVKLENDSLLLGGSLALVMNSENDKCLIEGSLTKDGVSHQFTHEASSFPTTINVLGENIRVWRNLNIGLDDYKDMPVYLSVNNPMVTASQLAAQLSIKTASKRASVLSIAINTLNAKKGEDILNALITKYNKENIESKNTTAYNTSIFINDRLASITSELEVVEQDVESYKQTQGITNLTGESELYMQQLSFNSQKKVDIETQLKVIEMVEAFIYESKNASNAIPNLSIADPGLSQTINDYNTKVLGYSSILSSTSGDNPARLRILSELSLKRNSILNLLGSVKKSINIEKRDVDRQLALNSSKIHSLPIQERGLLEKVRQQQIKENLYLFLLQKREETNIAMASTSDKAKFVIAPRISDLPVGPKNRLVLLGAFIVGFILSVLATYAKHLLQNKIENRDELERKSAAPVIGYVTKNDEPSNIVVRKTSNSPNSELFRYLKNNIDFVLEHKSNKIILVTSTVSGEGKTFVAANLACSFALDEKKVLLIGMDIRNPKLADVMGFKKGRGFADYISGNTESWNDLLSQPVKDMPGLDVLQGGTIPPNPNELLRSKRIVAFLEDAKSKYDFIIIDSAPLGIVSDTYLLSSYIDFTLYISREKVSYKSSISFLNTMYEEGRFPNVYVLLNDVNSKSMTYKYGYGNAYGYYTSK